MESCKRRSRCSAAQETKPQVCSVVYSQEEEGKSCGRTRGTGSDGVFSTEAGISAATVCNLPQQLQSHSTLAMATTFASYPKPAGHC